MTDIVERLRSGEDGLEYAAADEIERLHTALFRLIGAVDLANECLARGEGSQWVHGQLAPAVGAARESLNPTSPFGRWPGDESEEEIERLLKDF